MKNLKHGKGKQFYKDGTIKSDIDFVNDKFEGYGRYNYEDGEYYIGQWHNHLKHGKGKIYYKKLIKLNLMVILLMIKEKDMENFFGKMEIIIKYIFKMVFFMEKEKFIIVMEILHMMVILLKIKKKDMENLII